MAGNARWTALLARWNRSRTVRLLAGLGLVVHGFAHAVFPLRGAGSQANWTVAKIAIELGWILAMTGFVAGGCGLAGAWPLRRFWRACIAIAVAASVIAFTAVRRVDLLPNLVLDVVALAAFYRWSNFAEQEQAVRSRTAPSARWSRLRSIAASVSALTLTGYVATCALTRSWHSQWGVRDEELDLIFPGDSAERDPAFEVNHAVTIDAPPAAVWPWLVQIGQDRAGFYSHEALENLFGLRIHNADRIHPEWQNRSVGDLVRATPPDWLGGLGENLGWRITVVEPERALVLRGWGAFVLVPLHQDQTRLFVRSRVSGPNVPVWAAALSFATFEPIHFVMERQMLFGIKKRVESYIEPPPRLPAGAAIAGP